MLKNYFLVAFRNLGRNRVYSFINIAGLAAGMAVSLLIGLWIWNETTFNHYHRNHARLAIVYDNQITNGEINTDNGVDIPLAVALRSQYGRDIKHLALASGYETHLLTPVGGSARLAPSTAEKKVQGQCRWVGAELPGMLTLHFLRGNDQALADPASIILTASMAKALFGAADPMGQTVRIDNQLAFKVTGVYEDLPANTDYHFADFLLPWDAYAATHSWIKRSKELWGVHYAMLYVQLNEGVSFDQLTARIARIPQSHLPNSKETIFLQPMDRYHLYGSFANGQPAGGQIRFVRLFSTIALSILLLACINFMNLSTARSEKRAREVGIRKTLGSLRGQLIGQFLGESVLMALLSLVMGLLLATLLLPMFNGMARKSLTMPWGEPLFWLTALGFSLFTGLVSGSYPALYLSGFQPVKVLKGAIRVGRHADQPRKVLVVVQFTVSVILILGTLIIYRQVQYARARPVGYVREGLLSADILNHSELRHHFNAIRNDLLVSGAAVNVTGSNGPLTGTWGVRDDFSWKGQDPYAKPQFGWVSMTHDYGKTVGWQVLQGHNPSLNMATDSFGIVMNEAAVKLAGFQHPIGQLITVDGLSRPVIAVIRDMVMDSPYDPTAPTLFFMDYAWFNYITIRLNPGLRESEAISRVQQVFKHYDPDGLISYELPDEEYAMKFDVEQRIGQISTFFTVLAIFISCLGLFGLASFVAEQRTREIGVRKVLGASVLNLWGTLSREFMTLVLLACAIAIPAGALLLHQWLLQYTYRTPLSWWLFASAAGGALLVTLLTVSYQTIRAAAANPVKALRGE
jgi:ABC-type antimicrobial peptide transport system permease subunit